MPQASSGGASNITSANIVDNEIIDADIDDDAGISPSKITGEPYEVLAEVTLSAGATSLASGTFTARRWLRLIIYVPSVTGSQITRTQFNGDTGANYADKIVLNATNVAAQTAQSFLRHRSTTTTAKELIVLDVFNEATRIKLVRGGSYSDVDMIQIAGEWNNTTDQITSVTISAGGDMAAGTRLLVLGMD